DIEVEGTHNFVANGIIAHNTYISDKLGIGATNASYQLNVSGSGNITTNLNIGGTLTLGNLNIGSSYVLTSASGASGGQVAYLDTTSWDKDNTDDLSVLEEGYAIDITGTGIGRTIAFDSTEVSSTTWGSGSPFTWTFDAGATDPQLYLSSNIFAIQTGNVGIGTTNPLTKLHIEGQCVTGDSKLITQNGQTLQIKDVKGGEKILSLDETTGKIIPSTINGLLDMGVKPVYKLTTQDGKTIRTTGNHPYLAKTLLPTSPNQNSCDSNKNQSYNSQINISASGHISSPLPQKEKPNNNQYNATDHSSKKVGINNVPFNHFLIPLASNMETAENAKANINDTPKVKKNLDKFSGLTNKGETTPAENQATETLPNISEALSSWPIDNLPILFKNITNKLNNAQWTKIIYLSPGDEIAVADEKDLKFVKIASIEYIGEEQVYDIEVEGTHNFVANGIIAHNTYISDKLGIGATNASYQLHVSGSGNITTNLNIGGTLTLGNLNIGSSYVLTSASGASGGQVAYLDTTSWDKDSSDDLSVLEEGYAIDITGSGIGRTIAFDSTEVSSTTWGSGSPFTWTFDAGATDPQLYLSSNIFAVQTGNIGIGTTSPLTKLHIEGQCVTGDSLLPIVKKDSNHQKTTPNVVASGKPTDLPVNESDKLESSITNKNSLSSIKKDVEIGRIEPPSRSLSDSQGKPAIPTSTNNISQEIEYKKIKDIKGGEMVLSLDETTGKIIPAKIKGLLDMGVKPIYRLTTQDGKSIK
ncbi:hypothetical protein L6273_06270, partial [Candidatus Parcubacteria bacterium]|nr:hypothetical protein [Candidatus Parcubacteria bacterium]